MTFIAESITTFYEKEQDRLSLIFSNKGERQLLGLMTRQLFKSLLAQLSYWLTLQRTDSMPLTADQQWEISHIQHQVSQQKVAVTYEKIKPNHQLETFLIKTINFTKGDFNDGDHKIKLEFLNSNKTIQIIFVLNSAQLHKLMGEILKQVQAWDIDNPWQEKNTTPVLSDNKGRTIH
ncbi:hypothetical protein [Nitrosomonas sp. Nm166]|uniref:hypothetical protein n=1 Tax=Nitrosomonas sp. Nm166 TaxID=1881054 RepID=UPI0008EF5E7F|nr:hypothetical protein [Nitrosomonas sp. Nm166]SFE55414.1 hypothetical protein SAMN05428977_102030 [Nitrosomonas sp. Nm166]